MADSSRARRSRSPARCNDVWCRAHGGRQQPRFPPENRCCGPSRARRGTIRRTRHPSGRRRRARAAVAAVPDALALPLSLFS